MFVTTQILHLTLRIDRVLFLSRHIQILLFFPHENVCQPSSLQFKLRSIKTLLNWLQTVIDGQKSQRTLDEMSKLHRSRLDTSFCTRRSGSPQLASDETLPWTACTGTELHCKPTRSVDQLCEMCPSPTLHSSTHCSNDVSVDPVIGFSAGGSEANVVSERQRLHGEGGEGHDCRSRGTEASKEEVDTTNDNRVQVQHRVQFWSGIQCDDQFGNSSAQRNFDTTITSVLSDNSSLAPLGCEPPPEGEDESQTGKCTDDGRGFVKTLSGRLHGNFSEAHRWSMRVFQNKFKRCWMRRPLIDVILLRSAVPMFLA